MTTKPALQKIPKEDDIRKERDGFPMIGVQQRINSQQKSKQTKNRKELNIKSINLSIIKRKVNNTTL